MTVIFAMPWLIAKFLILQPSDISSVSNIKDYYHTC